MTHNYHCEIAGLPELKLNPKDTALSVADFVGTIKPFLTDNHVGGFNSLLYSKTHKAVIRFFATGNFNNELLPYFKPAWFRADSDDNYLLPAYLQRSANQFSMSKGKLNPHEMEAILYREYYYYLRQSGNSFIKLLAKFEMSLKNFLTAQKCDEYKLAKNEQIIGGDSFGQSLIRLPINHREIIAEWEPVKIVGSILKTGNPVKRELELDLLKWNYIDELNRFNYFTIEVILGYLLKLMIIERWRSLEKSSGQNLIAAISEKIVQAHLAEQRI